MKVWWLVAPLTLQLVNNLVYCDIRDRKNEEDQYTLKYYTDEA